MCYGQALRAIGAYVYTLRHWGLTVLKVHQLSNAWGCRGCKWSPFGGQFLSKPALSSRRWYLSSRFGPKWGDGYVTLATSFSAGCTLQARRCSKQSFLPPTLIKRPQRPQRFQRKTLDLDFWNVESRQVKESALECLGHLVACTGDWAGLINNDESSEWVILMLTQFHLLIELQICSKSLVNKACPRYSDEGPSRVSANDSRLPSILCWAHQERGRLHGARAFWLSLGT